MAICPHCLAANVSGPICPRCKGNLNWSGEKGMDLPVGTILVSGSGRRYWIGAARGRGGFGVTYAALETSSMFHVAIKEFFPTRCAFRAGDKITIQPYAGQQQIYQGGLNSFLKETRMLYAQSDLPSVVHILDFFQANNTAYIVMEYLDGLPLHALMQRSNGVLPAQDLLQKLKPVIRDLATLHHRHVLHRDISPDNLMWMPNGTIKLIDFGSARHIENGKSVTILMKSGFSPIEQYRSKGQGPYTDIYALAATIYYCTTGVRPPSAVDRLEQDRLYIPTDLQADLTENQESAILWGLSVQPTARPQSVEAFYQLLYAPSAPQKGGTIPPRREKKPQTPPQNPDLTRILIPAAAGIILAIVLAAVAAIFLLGGGDGACGPDPGTPESAAVCAVEDGIPLSANPNQAIQIAAT